MAQRARLGLGERGIRDAAARDARAHATRVGQRPCRRTDTRDSTYHRPRATRGYRHGKARRTYGLDRLRCAPSRWRHAHGVGNRGICRARPRVARRSRIAGREVAAHRDGRGRQRRDRQRRADARPRVRRGFERPYRYECLYDQCRQVRRAARNGERRPSIASNSISCWRWPRAASARSSSGNARL